MAPTIGGALVVEVIAAACVPGTELVGIDKSNPLGSDSAVEAAAGTCIGTSSLVDAKPAY